MSISELLDPMLHAYNNISMKLKRVQRFVRDAIYNNYFIIAVNYTLLLKYFVLKRRFFACSTNNEKLILSIRITANI